MLSKNFSIAVRNFNRRITCQSVREMRVVAIPANEDNYQYLIVDEHSNEAAIVDPVDVKSVFFYIMNYFDLFFLYIFKTVLNNFVMCF